MERCNVDLRGWNYIWRQTAVSADVGQGKQDGRQSITKQALPCCTPVNVACMFKGSDLASLCAVHHLANFGLFPMWGDEVRYQKES